MSCSRCLARGTSKRWRSASRIPLCCTVMRKVLPLTLLLATLGLLAQQTGVFSVLKSTVLLGKQPGDLFFVSSNQLLHPWGEQTVIPGRPVDMAWDSARRFLAVLNTRGIVLLDGSTGTKIADI